MSDQEYLTPHDQLREELTDERLLSNHLILMLAKLSPQGCRQVFEAAPHISELCRREALEYLDDLIYEGKCR